MQRYFLFHFLCSTLNYRDSKLGTEATTTEHYHPGYISGLYALQALGFVEGTPDNEGDGRPKRGVVAALAALTAEGSNEKAGEEQGANLRSAAAVEAAGVASTTGSAVPGRNRDGPKQQLSGS